RTSDGKAEANMAHNIAPPRANATNNILLHFKGPPTIKPVKIVLLLSTALLLFYLLSSHAGISHSRPFEDRLQLPAEKHLANIKQLTFGGENAEAYFSSDGKGLIFQSTRDGRECDQIYTMNLDGSNIRLVSTGNGRTTCSYFYPNGKKILYSSTHLGAK